MTRHILGLLFVGGLGVGAACGTPPEPTHQTTPAAGPTGCQPHIELKSAAFWAKELGRTEVQVLRDHRINLWSTPGKAAVVGKMLPGSRAVVLDHSADNYKVQSPLDQSIGWISAIQVERTINQDAETRQPC